MPSRLQAITLTDDDPICWRTYVSSGFNVHRLQWPHISVMASDMTGNPIVCSAACSGWQRRTSNHHISGYVMGNHQWPLDSPHKGSVKRKAFQRRDIIMIDWCVWLIDIFSKCKLKLWDRNSNKNNMVTTYLHLNDFGHRALMGDYDKMRLIITW